MKPDIVALVLEDPCWVTEGVDQVNAEGEEV